MRTSSVSLVAMVGLIGCMGPWDPSWSKDSGATGTTGALDSEPVDTEDSADTGEVDDGITEVTADITEDTLWTADQTYVIQDILFVEANLTIEAGTTIRFLNGDNGAGLVVTREGFLTARGEPDAPIVMTSLNDEGSRAPGDWGGLVLLGNATVNAGDNVPIEGLPSGDPRGNYGEDDAANAIDDAISDAGSCGTLEYVRIEFGGFKAFQDKELNGLTLGGCGSGTIIDHVQVHRIADDGVEVFGGTVDLKHVVISRVLDDGLDWDLGWRGRAQFVVIQQDGTVGNEGIEADNNEDGHDLEPRSAPTIYNMTIVGGGSSASQPQRAMVLRRGTGAVLRNLVLQGHSTVGIDLKDAGVADLVADGSLSIDNAIFYDMGSDGEQWADPDSGDDDAGFDELAWITAADNVVLGVNPGLPGAAYNSANPSFVPGGGSEAGNADYVATPPDEEFWDRSALYLGAFQPGAPTTRMDGWTDFPAD